MTDADEMEEGVRSVVAGIVESFSATGCDVFDSPTSPVAAFDRCYELTIESMKIRGVEGPHAHRIALIAVAGIAAQMTLHGIICAPRGP